MGWPFAVAGASKALAFGMGPVTALLLGLPTAIGGGMLHDVLVREIPVVLRADFYVSAALVGAAVVVAGSVLGWSLRLSSVAGGLRCFSLCAMVIQYRWHLPNTLRLR